MTFLTGGSVGVNTTGPDRRFDILDASNPQLRLTYTDGSEYTDFQTNSSGNLNITPSGGIVGIGTATPYAKLSVVGPVVAEYFHVPSTTATTTLQGTILAGSGGNVGIGTITPGAALEVTGNIRLSTGANRTLLVPDS